MGDREFPEAPPYQAGKPPPVSRARRETGGERDVKGNGRSRNRPARWIRFRPSASEYETLAALAKFHRSTVAELVSGALSRVIEKYRVLRALDRRTEEMTAGRRRR